MKPKTQTFADANRNLLTQLVERKQFAPATQTIAEHLVKSGSISQVEAQAMYKSRSLSRRISDIRDASVEVKSLYKNDETGQRYVRYVVE